MGAPAETILDEDFAELVRIFRETTAEVMVAALAEAAQAIEEQATGLDAALWAARRQWLQDMAEAGGDRRL